MFRSALALILMAATMASAEVPDDWKKIRSLLKDYDYEVEKKDDWVTATHEKYMNMYVKGYKDGILLQAYFTTSDMDVSERDIRRLNNKLSLNATAVPDSTSMVMEISCARHGSLVSGMKIASISSSKRGTTIRRVSME